ncbi:MAG: LytTR family DNA-binding domain-containing protein [Bacteroidota bacterium]
MKTIIIEDGDKTREQLKELLSEHCKQVQVIGEAENADEGAKLILDSKPDLVLLDIQMPKKTGFDMLRSLGVYEFEVIFITGYEEYAIQAIRCSALDYLLKPVEVAELTRAIAKAEKKISDGNIKKQIENLLNIVSHPNLQDHKIALPVAKGYQFINPVEIVFLEAMNNYTAFHMANKEKILISKGMYQFEEILLAYGFIRCHSAHIINLKWTDKFVKGITGYELFMKDGSSIPVTPKYVSVVKKALLNR